MSSQIFYSILMIFFQATHSQILYLNENGDVFEESQMNDSKKNVTDYVTDFTVSTFKPIMENSFSYNQTEMKLAIVIGCTEIVIILLIVITINYVCTLYVKVSVYSFIRF